MHFRFDETIEDSDPTDPVNTAPIANAGVNMLGLLVGNSLILDGSASSDEDGEEFSYKWSVY